MGGSGHLAIVTSPARWRPRKKRGEGCCLAIWHKHACIHLVAFLVTHITLVGESHVWVRSSVENVKYTPTLDRPKSVFLSLASVSRGFRKSEGFFVLLVHLAKRQWRSLRSVSSETGGNFGNSRDFGNSRVDLLRVRCTENR